MSKTIEQELIRVKECILREWRKYDRLNVRNMSSDEEAERLAKAIVKPPVVEAGEGVWPKKKSTDKRKMFFTEEETMKVNEWNSCHDAFTSALKQKGLL